MRGFPLLPGLAALAVSFATGCGEQDRSSPEVDPDKSGAETATIPFAFGEPLSTGDGDFILVSDAGDTLRFRATSVENGRYVRLVRTRRMPAGLDSVAALIDGRTKAPIASYQRRHTEAGDSIVARVSYGTGFEGQARLTLITPDATGSENLRTPDPLLDAAQIPQTLSALDFSTPDTISFNYVAPFEQRALAARVEIGDLDTLRIGGEPVPAYVVSLRVQGLEERAWFAASPGRHRLLRYEEPTRGVTWTRPRAE